MMIRTTLALLAVTALLSACDTSSSPSNTSPNDNMYTSNNNGGLSTQVSLTQEDLNLIASFDHQSYFSELSPNFGANPITTLASQFQNVGDLQSAFSVVNSNCTTTSASSYILACGSGSTTVDGSYGLESQKIIIKLNVKTANSSAAISHVSDLPAYLNESGGTLTNVIDDSLSVSGANYVIRGQAQTKLGAITPVSSTSQTLSMPFSYTGALDVARDGNSPVTISITSTNAKVVIQVGSASSLCGGEIRYSAPNGLQKIFALPKCPS